MLELICSKDKKARKQYRCDCCGRPIEKGEVYDWQKNIFDGTFYEWRCHLSCSRVTSAIWDYVDPDEGMHAEEFHEGCHEICRRFICPDCPNWNEEFDDCEIDEQYCIDRMDKFFETHELYRAGRQAYYETWKCREKAGG